MGDDELVGCQWAFGTISLEGDNLVVRQIPYKKGIIRKEWVDVPTKSYPLACIEEIALLDGTFLVRHRGSAQGFQGASGAVATFLDHLKARGVSVRSGTFRDTAEKGSGRMAQVKTYKDEHEFQRDAERMLHNGWIIAGQSEKQQRVAVMRTAGKAAATGLIGLALTGRSKKGGGITVTWVWLG